MKNIKVFTLTLVALLTTLCTAYAQTPAQNKETSKKILAAVDAGDLAAFAMYVSPSMVEHMPPPPGVPADISGFELGKMMIAAFHTAFPDGKTTIQHMISEGDMVSIHSVFTGTNKGDFMGMPATNKAVKIEQIDMIRFDAAGKGVEHWSVSDQLAMMQQLGVIPTEKK
jgi:predicted ester cyclase